MRKLLVNKQTVNDVMKSSLSMTTVPRTFFKSQYEKARSTGCSALRWVAMSVSPYGIVWCCNKNDLPSIFSALRTLKLNSDTVRVELLCHDDQMHWASLIVAINQKDDQKVELFTLEVDGLYGINIIPDVTHASCEAIKKIFPVWHRYCFTLDHLYSPIQVDNNSCRVIALQLCMMFQYAATDNLFQCMDRVSTQKIDSVYYFSLASMVDFLASHDDVDSDPSGAIDFYPLMVFFSIAQKPRFSQLTTISYVGESDVVKKMLNMTKHPQSVVVKKMLNMTKHPPYQKGGSDVSMLEFIEMCDNNPVELACYLMFNKMMSQLEAINSAMSHYQEEFDLLDIRMAITAGCYPKVPLDAKESLCLMSEIMWYFDNKIDSPAFAKSMSLHDQTCLFKIFINLEKFDRAYLLLSSTESPDSLLVFCSTEDLSELLTLSVDKNDWLIVLRLIGRSALGYRCLSTSRINKGLIPMFSSTIYDQLAGDQTLIFSLFDVAECLGPIQFHSKEAQLKLLRLYVQYKRLVDTRFKGSVLNMHRLCEALSLSPDGLSVGMIDKKLHGLSYVKMNFSFYASTNQEPPESTALGSLDEPLLRHPSHRCCAIS